ncbi:hypothetical protein [uncultured Algibacter sp.]|uniref:hypothetical protein n=1 Tax=uncultured Algibacter sp. TaxID=298659 RepID=UPI003217C71A
MRKTITLFIIVLSCFSCKTSMESYASNAIKDGLYKNTLIVIPYTIGSKKYSKKLKQKLLKQYENHSNKVDFLLFEKEDYKLFLYTNSEIDKKIQKIITDDKKDFLIIFKSTDVNYTYQGLRSVHYEVSGIDVASKKEIWKAKLHAKSGLGPETLVKKTARIIYQKLEYDRIYN